jgi:ferredoxin
MTYLVTENCIKCKYTDCVEVCPVDAFHEGPNFLAINPDECIDCNVCVVECPANAIYPDTDETIDVAFWTDVNTRLSQKWPVITKAKDPLPDADKWKDAPDKLKHLEE